MQFRTILAGLTGFPPPLSERRGRSPHNEDMNAGRRVRRNPNRQEKCFNCRTNDALIFVYAPPTSQLAARDSGYCEPCWNSYTANPRAETVR